MGSVRFDSLRDSTLRAWSEEAMFEFGPAAVVFIKDERERSVGPNPVRYTANDFHLKMDYRLIGPMQIATKQQVRLRGKVYRILEIGEPDNAGMVDLNIRYY